MTIQKAEKADLQKILDLQYLAYQSEAKLFNNIDIPPLKQTLEDSKRYRFKGCRRKQCDCRFGAGILREWDCLYWEINGSP